MKKGIKISLALILTLTLASSSLMLLWPANAQAATTTLKVAQWSDPVTLDPYDSWDSGSNDICLNLYDTLVMYTPGTLNFTEGLAIGWQIESTTIRFNIRQNVTFHNGDPLTPFDIWWSLERALPLSDRSWAFDNWLANATLNPDHWNWSELDLDRESGVWDVYDPILNITIEDVGFVDGVDFFGTNATAGDGWAEIVVEFDYAFSPGIALFAYAGLSIVNPAVATELGPHDMQFAPVGAGSGPFMLDTWVANSYVRMEKNEDYWGQVPAIDMVEFLTIEEATTRTLALQTGEIQLTYPEPQDFFDFQANPSVEVWREAGLGTRYLGFNTNTTGTSGHAMGVLDIPEVREALAYAVNYDEMILGEIFNNGLATRMLGPMVPSIPWAYNDSLAQVNETGGTIPNYNLTKANQTLNDLGYLDVDDDGIRDIMGWSNNVTDDFKLTYSYNIGNAVREAVGELVFSDFGEIGIAVTITGRTWDQHLAAIASGAVDMFFVGWGPDYIDPDTYFYPLFHSKFIGTYGNGARVNSTEVDTWLENGRSETNQTTRAEIYNNLTNYLLEQNVWAWCYLPDNTYAWRTELTGFTHSPLYQMDDLEYCELGAIAGAGIPIEIIAVVVGVVVAVIVVGGLVYWRRGSALK